MSVEFANLPLSKYEEANQKISSCLPILERNDSVAAMKSRPIRIAGMLLVLSLNSCIDAYTPRMTAEDREDARARVNAVDDENFYRRDRERQSEADAYRKANAGAPVHYHRTYAPSYGY